MYNEKKPTSPESSPNPKPNQIKSIIMTSYFSGSSTKL